MNDTYQDDAMPDAMRLDWDKQNAELDEHRKVLKELEERAARLDAIERLSPEANRAPGVSYDHPGRAPAQINRMSRGEVHDLNTLTRTNFMNPEVQGRELSERAERALEFANFPHERADQDASKAHVEKLLRNNDSADREIARRILVTGSTQYRSAMNKWLAGQPRTSEEERAMTGLLATTTTGGYAVVYELDPTFIRTSNLSVNPFRAIARQVTLAGTSEWRGVTSAGIVAAYAAEALEASDNSPTLGQPAAIVQRAQAFVPFSIEAGQDINGLQGELATGIQDAKDDLEANEFTTGAGTTVHPQGILVGATSTTSTATTGAFVIADMYSLEQALKPRSRPRAVFVANRFFYNKVRAFDTAGGAGMWYGGVASYAGPLSQGMPNNVPTDGALNQTLLGYRAYEDSQMVASLTTTSKIAVFGDFSQFVIVDRIGMNIEIAPMLFGASNRFPTGQRGLYAYWRNTSKVLDASAFQILVT
jgi:HK97 family phage major capsid protein